MNQTSYTRDSKALPNSTITYKFQDCPQGSTKKKSFTPTYQT